MSAIDSHGSQSRGTQSPDIDIRALLPLVSQAGYNPNDIR